MRLGGIGSTESEGYVEALGTDGQWAGICDNSFDIFDAHVICKMLGFSTAIEALTNSTADDLYGTAPSGSNFTLNNLDCSGSESSVFDCPLTGEVSENCEATKIAGVRCACVSYFILKLKLLNKSEIKKNDLVKSVIFIARQNVF